MKKFIASTLAAFGIAATGAQAQEQTQKAEAIPPINIKVNPIPTGNPASPIFAQIEYYATSTYDDFSREELKNVLISIQPSEDLQTFGHPISSVVINDQFLDILEKAARIRKAKEAGEPTTEQLTQNEHGLITTNPPATDTNNNGKMFFRLQVPDSWMEERNTNATASATYTTNTSAPSTPGM